MAYPSSPKTATQSEAVSPKKDSHGGGSWFKGLITLIIVLIIIGGGVYLLSSYTGIGMNILGPAKFEKNWQAIFLSNGQVYFGKITKLTTNEIILKDIYYLQVVTTPLQRSQQAEAGQEQEQRLTLIKLGNEIHGPEDEMVINRRHVIIMEDLKDDSRVVQAINDYTANQPVE